MGVLDENPWVKAKYVELRTAGASHVEARERAVKAWKRRQRRRKGRSEDEMTPAQIEAVNRRREFEMRKAGGRW